ncbi:MAG TPA: DUF4383 domain-containing protein [Gemmatimonadaceae bacterium]|nr:DUF4383 domain-containing protein [Gemmatimonadaceae bacterium]
MNLMQRVAAIFGVAFLVAGALGFTAAGASMHDMHTSMSAAPRLLGLFPVNVTHNAVHLAFGVWGIAAAFSRRQAGVYAMVSGVIYAALAGAGAFWPTLFGVVPIGGYDVGLHLVIALVLIGCTVYSATVENDQLVTGTTTTSAGR